MFVGIVLDNYNGHPHHSLTRYRQAYVNFFPTNHLNEHQIGDVIVPDAQCLTEAPVYSDCDMPSSLPSLIPLSPSPILNLSLDPRSPPPFTSLPPISMIEPPSTMQDASLGQEDDSSTQQQVTTTWDDEEKAEMEDQDMDISGGKDYESLKEQNQVFGNEHATATHPHSASSPTSATLLYLDTPLNGCDNSPLLYYDPPMMPADGTLSAKNRAELAALTQFCTQFPVTVERRMSPAPGELEAEMTEPLLFCPPPGLSSLPYPYTDDLLTGECTYHCALAVLRPMHVYDLTNQLPTPFLFILRPGTHHKSDDSIVVDTSLSYDDLHGAVEDPAPCSTLSLPPYLPVPMQLDNNVSANLPSVPFPGDVPEDNTSLKTASNPLLPLLDLQTSMARFDHAFHALAGDLNDLPSPALTTFPSVSAPTPSEHPTFGYFSITPPPVPTPHLDDILKIPGCLVPPSIKKLQLSDF
ncbi:hypothetical protein LXA43DRAFT_1068475 [Ganoderma leucocontextum]|nr:hypothetical protein LXA43DRAFT_1068475 [Ganoderma leucocontextum]